MEHKPDQISSQEPGNEMPWSKLTDRQRTQLLLNSTRLPDAELFIQKYTSWEQPDCTNEQKADTS